MTSIVNIMGGAFTPPKTPQPDPPEAQLAAAMEAAGIRPPASIQLDGKLHRFPSYTNGKPGHDPSGYYIAFGDGIPAGKFGCWRAGIEQNWRADVGRQLSVPEQMAMAQRQREAQAARDEAKAKAQEVVADVAETIWAGCVAAEPGHPYLARKGVQPHGTRVTGDGRLVLPLYNADGDITSLQYIDHDSDKKYHAGGVTSGSFWTVGTFDEPGVIYIAEGFATAATIHEVTGRPCVVSYSANNLVPVTGTIRDRHGIAQEIVIVADHDASGVGEAKATQASAKHGARVVVIPMQGDANDYVAAGHDLASLLDPPKSDWLVPADDFCTKPAPIKWLVKGWLQEAALIMVHGPSGGGKTFVVLDWCLHIAAGLPEWMGHKVRPGPIVYLAGEGHHGLRARVSAWKQHHQAGSLNMWLSKAGCDLNTPAGYQMVVDAVRSLPEKPKAIVVDTLHRFLMGDENSAQDAKTMIDACAALMREFECSVILVHHTGVSDEAQHRARGSSAWRGALEIEISVIPAKGDGPLQIVQRKMKDGEEADPKFAELVKVPLAGWLDDDDEQVYSAVLGPSEAPARTEYKESPALVAFRVFEAAWWDKDVGNQEVRDGKPYLTRATMRSYLGRQGFADKTIRNKLEVGREGSLTNLCLPANMIEPYEHGWRLIAEPQTSGMMAAKNG